MAKLHPFVEEDAIKAEVLSVLESGGLVKKSAGKIELEAIRGMFNSSNAGIENVATMVGSILRNSDDDGIRLKAGELALKVHGLFKEMDEKQVPTVNITIVGDGAQPMINLFCPQP